jgi:hypothetical protein
MTGRDPRLLICLALVAVAAAFAAVVVVVLLAQSVLSG